jgi:hypothetical protein
VQVYVSRDRRWRIEVRDNGWVYVFDRSMPAGRYRSLRDAADWLIGQGLSPDDIVED